MCELFCEIGVEDCYVCGFFVVYYVECVDYFVDVGFVCMVGE